jgi:uncharacterized membrane protein HdeD (DUF308 family)
MKNILVRNWWLSVARGLIVVIFGILALVWPEQTKLTLVLLFGAFALADGLFTLFVGIALNPYITHWWAMVLEGVIGIVIGLLTFIWPDITALALLYFIAAWALLTGIFEIVTAIQLRRVIAGEWVMAFGGIASILFGVLLFVFPGAGAVSLMWLIGMYAIAFGILEIIVAFRIRGLWHNFKAAVESGIGKTI